MDQPDHQVHPAEMALTVLLDSPDNQENEVTKAHRTNPFWTDIRSSVRAKLRSVTQADLVYVVPTDPPVIPAQLAAMENQETKDHVDHLAKMANPASPVRKDRRANQEKSLPCPAPKVSQEVQAAQAHPDHWASRAHQEKTVNQELPAARANLANPAVLENQAYLVQMGTQEKPETPAAAPTAHRPVWLPVIRNGESSREDDYDRRCLDIVNCSHILYFVSLVFLRTKFKARIV